MTAEKPGQSGLLEGQDSGLGRDGRPLRLLFTGSFQSIISVNAVGPGNSSQPGVVGNLVLLYIYLPVKPNQLPPRRPPIQQSSHIFTFYPEMCFIQ